MVLRQVSRGPHPPGIGEAGTPLDAVGAALQRLSVGVDQAGSLKAGGSPVIAAETAAIWFGEPSSSR